MKGYGIWRSVKLAVIKERREAIERAKAEANEAMKGTKCGMIVMPTRYWTAAMIKAC